MTKKEIKEIIKEYKYRMIPHSWYSNKDGALFYAYDDCGMCHQFYISWKRKKAIRQMLSPDTLIKEKDITFMFYGEV